MSLRGRQAGTTSVAPRSRFLIVTVGGTHLALHADRVQGLLTMEEAGLAEALTVQGLTYARLDLGTPLHFRDDAEGPDTRIVLLSSGSVRGNIRVAQVHGLKEIEQFQVLPLPRHFQGEEQGWYHGILLFEESVALVLNPAWVMEGCAVRQVSKMVEQRGHPQRMLAMSPALSGGQIEPC